MRGLKLGVARLTSCTGQLTRRSHFFAHFQVSFSFVLLCNTTFMRVQPTFSHTDFKQHWLSALYIIINKKNTQCKNCWRMFLYFCLIQWGMSAARGECALTLCKLLPTVKILFLYALCHVQAQATQTLWEFVRLCTSLSRKSRCLKNYSFFFGWGGGG